LLRLSHIIARYYGVAALKDVSIVAEEGSITTLIGANGSGKSTLLNTIVGLMPIESGEIWYMDERIDGMEPEKIVSKGITLVPEGRGLFDYMTVHDNLLSGAYLRKDKEGIKRDLEKAYEYFPDLKNMTKRMARNMSGGEQQMLAFARGLMSKPKFLLLDEPSMGLAPLLVQEVMHTVRKIAKTEEIGVILVEQNASLALNLAEKAYVLELGEIVLEGDPKELINDPNVKRAYLGM
jgi:branched-chain amino acid transport system ATP-binding protein